MGSLNKSLVDDDDVLSSINIVPFVDIVLVLLIIFMLTSSVIVKASLMVNLPRAASGGASVESTLNFVYTSDGKLLVNGQERTLDQAAKVAAAEVRADPKTQAVISADKKIDYGKVIELIDRIKLSGVTTFALDVERSSNQ
jgi:biopolymer transport protein ExbD